MKFCIQWVIAGYWTKILCPGGVLHEFSVVSGLYFSELNSNTLAIV